MDWQALVSMVIVAATAGLLGRGPRNPAGRSPARGRSQSNGLQPMSPYTWPDASRTPRAFAAHPTVGRWEMGDLAENDGEDEHRQKGPDYRPGDADHGLFVPNR